jgi:hypothetical protein
MIGLIPAEDIPSFKNKGVYFEELSAQIEREMWRGSIENLDSLDHLMEGLSRESKRGTSVKGDRSDRCFTRGSLCCIAAGKYVELKFSL